MKTNTDKLDLCFVFLIVMMICFLSIYLHVFKVVPAEDAAMLMRYAEHFAHGHGIVWNIGGKPVDGATDFLFMIFVGLLVKIGLAVETATRVIGILSHTGTAILIYMVMRKLQRASFISASLSSLFLVLGPGLYYTAACFGTPLFALLATITWCSALIIMEKGGSTKWSILFALAGVITGIIRPEGVILAVLMLAAIVFRLGLKKSRQTIITFTGVFLLIGGSYFIWRWRYFGFPLPNPFYKKGNWVLYLESLKESIIFVIKMCLPFLPVFIISLFQKRTFRLTMYFLVPVIGFTLSFVFLSNEMNFLYRFQYAVLPIVLLSWYPLMKKITRSLNLPLWSSMDRQKRKIIGILTILFLSGIVYYQYKTYRNPGIYRQDSMKDVAIMLSKYSEKGYTMATSEAGLLPLYSKWHSIDTWGLNNQWIAHNGGITQSYLDRYKPHVLIFYGFFPFNNDLLPFTFLESINSYKFDRTGKRWTEMGKILKKYAEKNGYVLAAAYGESLEEIYYYYVRSDFKESAEIINKIRNIDYIWFKNGRRALNFALVGPK